MTKNGEHLISLTEKIEEILINIGLPDSIARIIGEFSILFFIIIMAFFINLVTKKIALKILEKYILNNRFKWDNIMLENKLFLRLSHIVPAIFIFSISFLLDGFRILVQRGTAIYIVFIITYVIDAFLNSINDIYKTFDVAVEKPIKGYLQVIKIFVIIISSIIVISILINRNPIYLLSGIGAMSAVVMLVFRDSILGLVAGIQLTANDMVRIGDWIEMPKYLANGDVIDISLNTVKIRNFDSTITTVPTYALISDSFKNWRGMSQSGGRRIMRSIYIDVNNIKMVDSNFLKDLETQKNFKKYIISNREELLKYDFTNLTILRKYISYYLKNHPNIHKEMIIMCRQLETTEKGVPLEIYAFTNNTDWTEFESIQSDIFDYLIGIIPCFKLKLYQDPTGEDIRSIYKKNK